MPWVKHSLGISLGRESAELVYLRSTLRGQEIMGRLATPLSSEGEEGLQEIQKFLLRHGVRPSDAVTLGLPREDLFFRHFTTPPIREKDLGDLVAFESRRHLPGKSEEFLVGHQSLGRSSEGGFRLLLAAVRRDVIEKRLALMRRVNLVPRSIQPSSMGLVEAFRSSSPEAPPTLLLTIGGDAFTADYLAEGKLVESSHVPLRRGGASAEGKEGPSGGEALAGVVAEKISRPHFLQALPGGALPRLVLHGPFAFSIAEALEARLRSTVQIFSPMGRFPGGSGPDAEGRFGSALGLALLGLRGGEGSLEVSEEAAEGEREKPQYRSTAVLAAVLFGLLAMNLTVHGVKAHRQLGLIEKEAEALQKRKAVVERLSREARKKRDRLEFLSHTIHGQVRQADLLRELTVLIPEDAYLSDYTYRDGRLEIGGLAPSASRLIPILEASPLFSEVAFSSAIVSQGKDLERFKIRLSIEGGGNG